MPVELRKKTKDGTRYNRPPEIEAKLEQLEGVEPADRIQLFEPSSRKLSDYIPSEVLVYFLRRAWADSKHDEFEKIFKLLMWRVESSLKSAINDGRMERACDIREEIIGMFAVRIAEDCRGQSDWLDFFEVRFDKALLSFRVSVLRQIGPMMVKVKTVPLLSDEGDNFDLSPEVEVAAANFLDRNSSKLDDSAFRLSLLAAIDKLPDDQKQVVSLLLKNFPIDSKDPNAMTIARILGCTERTVRNRRDRAFKTLKAELHEEWVQ